jgi:hypothetical protein
MQIAASNAAHDAREVILAGFISACLASSLAGCAYQRSEEAVAAQNSMIGMTQERIHTCMGAPFATQTTRDTEIWTYNSENNSTYAKLFCKVDFVMTKGLVSGVSYSGHTGGLISKDEQCASLVENCITMRPPSISQRLLGVFRF